ncbi:hypothetical protein [Halorubrum ezzemoulense]|uniref:hypothetical protein n=1 Tax=Halorubrum ezzemoulense TaxID=337243 RepID=UPI00111BDBD5|nr:hypothetical protein [Halorubrum ezzemoulense]
MFVFHPPRTYASENADLQRRRKQLVATLGNAQYRLESNENLDSVPVLTIENVCPRGPFEYLLTEESDVEEPDIEREDDVEDPETEQDTEEEDADEDEDEDEEEDETVTVV